MRHETAVMSGLGSLLESSEGRRHSTLGYQGPAYAFRLAWGELTTVALALLPIGAGDSLDSTSNGGTGFAERDKGFRGLGVAVAICYAIRARCNDLSCR